MLIKDFITKEYPVLKSFDTVEYALGLMDDFKLKHLPLLNDGFYQALISEKDLLSSSDMQREIGETSNFAPSITENTFVHEALGMMTRYGLTLLPVIKEDGEYIGALTRDKMIDILSQLCSADMPGSIIVLEIMPQDYSLTDIARLIESNNAHVLNLFTYHDISSGKIQIIIKIDLEDASPVIRSFERFNYSVLYYFMEKGIVDDLFQSRLEELEYYMNI